VPIARVQLPDGRVARLEVPEGTTPQQVESFVFNGMKAPQKAAPTATPEEPTRIERLGRGFMDVAQGVKQAGLMVKDLVTGGNDADAYTKEKSDELALYEQGRGKDAGIDWMRIGGNVLATAPVALIPGGAAASMGVRAASGAAQGAVASGAMFTPEGESKLAQTTIGALVGGAVPVAAQGVKAAGRRVLDLVRGPQAIPANQVVQELTVKLQQQGIDFGKLTQQARDSLLDDAQKALSAGGTLDDAMLANKALIESVGAKPTKASITRAPRDWQTEKNLRGIQGVGDDIVRREQSNASALIDYTQRIRSGTGGKASTALEAGESAINAIKVQDKAKENAVGELYSAFRDSGLKDELVPETKLTETLTRIIDEVGLDNVPPSVQSRLKDFGFLGGNRTRQLTVQEADTFNRLLNANNPGHGAASKTIGMIKGALNESLIETPGGGEKLLRAREAAAQRFAEQRAGKGIAAAVEDVAPDRFVKKFVLDADVRDVRAMVAELNKSPLGKQAIADVKGNILGDLLMKSTGATNLDDVAGKPFSGVKFGKALDAIQPEKLHQIFSPAEVESLRTLQRASKLLTEEVPFSDVNHSKTTAALANLLQKIGNTPLLGQIVSPIIGVAKVGSDWVKDANARKQVAEALLASAGKAGVKPALPVFPVERAIPGAAGAFAAEPQAGER
jgi:hypothetical protein